MNRCLNAIEGLETIFTKKEMDELAMLDNEMLDVVISDKLGQVKIDKKQKFLQSAAIDRLVQNLPDDPKAIKRYINGLVGQDRTRFSPGLSLEHRANGVLYGAQNELRNLMIMSAPKKLGIQDQVKTHHNIVRAIFGESAGDADVAKAAKSWTKIVEDLRVRANRAGANISKLEGWHLPQHHNPGKVSKAGFEEWAKDIADWLDYTKMGITRQEFEAFKKDVYNNIATDGTIKIEPGKVPPRARAKIASRHQERRILKFKNADSWLAYQTKYGNDNIYASMMDHVTMLSKEIAAMEMFGPNPDTTVRFITDTATKATGDKLVGKTLEKEFAVYMGYTSPDNVTAASIMATLRNIETGAKLSGATLSALPDVWFSRMTTKFMGIPVTGMMIRRINNLLNAGLNPKKLSEISAQLHLGLEHAIDSAHTASRYANVTGRAASAKFAEFSMRASALNAWTVSNKVTFGQQVIKYLTDGNFSPRFMEFSKQYGLTDADFAALKAAPRIDVQGVEYVDFSQMKPEHAEKFVGMISSETRMAVPESDVKTQALMTQATKAGTLGGEIIRSGGQFLTFPIHILTSHFARALNEPGMSRIGYLANMTVGLTILGTMSVQLKEISRGREPVAWDNPELWKRGFVQGGVTGIIGDFLFNDVDRFGYSTASRFAGPIINDFDKYIMKGLFGSVQDAWDGDFEAAQNNAIKTLGNMAVDFNPLSTLWYTRLAFDRAVNDTIHKLTDPDWESKWNSKESKRNERFENDYFLPPQ
jgi:hypothetical protein